MCKALFLTWSYTIIIEQMTSLMSKEWPLSLSSCLGGHIALWSSPFPPQQPYRSDKMVLCSNCISFMLYFKILLFNLLKLMNKTEALSQFHFPLKIARRYTYHYDAQSHAHSVTLGWLNASLDSSFWPLLLSFKFESFSHSELTIYLPPLNTFSKSFYLPQQLLF